MTEPVSGLRTLVELPPSVPPPVEDIHRRVAVRRRRRQVSRAALAGVAVVLAGVAVVPLLEQRSDAPTQVVAAATGLPEVARAAASGSTLVLQADENCAYLRWVDAQPADPPVAGGCGTRTRDHSVQTFGPPVVVGDGSTAAILSGGPAMVRYSAHLADGRAVEGLLAGGWGVVVADSRIVGVSGIDARGLPVPEWVVP